MRQRLKVCRFLLIMLIAGAQARSQAVSEIITDYNGYYKTNSSSVNPIQPDNNHNLLAFSFNGTRYSTGANDALLTSNSETFTPMDFRALPLQNYTGIPTSNTKIGLGAMADGVFNGAGAAPSRNLGQYLNDGANGLNLGTGVANFPAGTLFLSVSNLQAGNIGDGIPDILVTQIADPAGSLDRYAFTDIDGNTIGNTFDVALNNISPVGRWVADFYEATGSTVLAPGFTQTSRDVRLWAADFSIFGINASNISSVAYFKIINGGNSDLAFVAYNTKTVTVHQVLTLPDRLLRKREVRKNDDTKTLAAFPNPAKTTITLSHPEAEQGTSIVIYNAAGVAVLKRSVNKNSKQTVLDISALSSGFHQAVYQNDTIRLFSRLLIQ